MRTGTRTHSGLRCACRGRPRAPRRPGAGAAAAGARRRFVAAVPAGPVTTSARSACPSPNRADRARRQRIDDVVHRPRRCPRPRSDVTPRPRSRTARCGRTSRGRGHVEGDAVQGAPAPRRHPLGPHADRGDLAGALPAASTQTPGNPSSGAAPGQAEVGERRRSPARSSRWTCAAPERQVVGHGHDRVRHELARTVVRHVAAAVGALERRPRRTPGRRARGARRRARRACRRAGAASSRR